MNMDISPVHKAPPGSPSTHKTYGLPRLWVALALLLMMAAATGCRDAWDEKEEHNLKTDSLANRYISIADSINYGVVIKSRDTSDNWQEKWLKSFDREEFVDFIFEAVYEGRLQAYDYFTQKPLSLKAVKNLEARDDFRRSRVGKLQFKERWYFNTSSLQMVKEVYAVMLAYEVYRDDGTFRGYKPAFMVRLPANLKQ
jgi:hypothetical protein